MIYYIPGELIALVTFPGVIIHEIAHRLFCDLTNVGVYKIYYFIPFSQTAGCVIHEPTKSLWRALLISTGPLIINSLVCMLLTIPFGITLYLGTTFAIINPKIDFFKFIALMSLTWIGYLAGFNAIPSNQDMSGLSELTQSRITKFFLFIFIKIIAFFNVHFFIQAFYALVIGQIVPLLMFYYW